MKTIKDILFLSEKYLKDHQVQQPRKSVEEILSFVLGYKRLDLYLHFDQPLNEAELNLVRQFLSRRKTHEPLSYIFETVPFYHCSIAVSKEVLIPRSETEQLVDRVVESLYKKEKKQKILWDLCTGSGCIAIAIKKAIPHLKVIATDISEEALHCAKKNALHNHVDIEFYQGDFLQAYQGSWDYLVCNPPYISEDEYCTLDKAVVDFEPKIALVSGQTGLEFYECLATSLRGKGKKIFLEIGYNQANQVKKIFESKDYRQGKIYLDWQGKERFFFLEFE